MKENHPAHPNHFTGGDPGVSDYDLELLSKMSCTFVFRNRQKAVLTARLIPRKNYFRRFTIALTINRIE